jgi:hypothetical protein
MFAFTLHAQKQKHGKRADVDAQAEQDSLGLGDA